MVETVATRRRFLLLGSLAATSGCSLLGGERPDATRTDLPTPTDDGRDTLSPPGDCKLRHNTFNKDRDHGIAESYDFTELSDRAKTYFLGAKRDGAQYVIEDTDLAPPEYAYTDVVTKYEIRYDGATYILGTWSGAGCRVD